MFECCTRASRGKFQILRVEILTGVRQSESSDRKHGEFIILKLGIGSNRSVGGRLPNLPFPNPRGISNPLEKEDYSHTGN